MTTGQVISAEQSLYANLIAEAIQIHGHDVYYLDRTLVAEDTVLGEDSLSKFNTQAPIEMYMENSDGGYAGEREVITQFGLENLSEATFVVSKVRFQEKTKQIQIEDGTDSTSSGSILLESGSIATSKLEGETFYILNETDATDADRPLEGDAIYHPLLKKLFEINFVDHDDPFHQLMVQKHSTQVLQILMRLKILSQLQVRITSLLLKTKQEVFYLKLVVMSILYRKTI